jgi:DoxX-like protein
MSTAAEAAKMATPPKRWMIWTGRVLSAIPVLLLVMSAAFAFRRTPEVIEGMKKFGYPESKLFLIAVLEMGSALIYAVPRTAVLGAILMTGYLGGAVATHVRIGDPGYPTAIIAGIFVWAGLYLRDERLRALLPLRRAQ